VEEQTTLLALHLVGSIPPSTIKYDAINVLKQVILWTKVFISLG
jgi:hypothetical protein